MPFPIAPSFTVQARGGPPDAECLDRARALGVSDQYCRLVEDGADLELLHDSGIDVRVHDPCSLPELDEAYGVSRRLPGCVLVGGIWGMALVESADGLSAVGWGALDPDELERVADDLEDLVSRGRLGDMLRYVDEDPT